MLRSESLQFKRGDELLFENLNFVVHPGQRIAVAGRNGVGKSTLFHLILGNLQSDIGELNFPTSWRLGYMEQEPEVTHRPALEYVIDGHEELRRTEHAIATEQDDAKLANLHSTYQDLGGYEAAAKAGEILYGLGFNGDDFDKPYSAFSGGWRIRPRQSQILRPRPSDGRCDGPPDSDLVTPGTSPCGKVHPNKASCRCRCPGSGQNIQWLY